MMMVNSILILSFIFLSYSSLSTSLNNETDLDSLLAFKSAIDVDPQGALNSWNETHHFCSWRGICCSRRHGRVVGIKLMSRGFVGSLSPHVGNLSFLRFINLQNNTFHTQIPQEIGRLRRLESLILSNNSFLGSIPRNLSQCRNLFELDLIDNNLSGTIPHSLSLLYKLESLGLMDNTFSGPIPSFLGNLTSLRQLGLSYSFSQGEIPESFLNLNKLLYLLSASNNLTGTIPSGLFNISTIRILSLNFNHLQGNIPSTIGLTLPNLESLQVALNQFTGLLPVSLSNATFLARLNFAGNYFTGPMPRGMGKLPNLEMFIVADNPIQDDISFISLLTNCTDDMYELCGGIPELELPPCASLKKNGATLLKILIPTCSAVVAAFLCFIIFMYRRERRRRVKNSPSVPSFMDDQVLRLSYADLVKATEGFCASNLVGAGRFGSVYKGVIEDGQRLVAVKVLNLVVRGAAKSFMAECNALRGVRHRNLVKILSVCESIDFQGNEFKAIVYEFKANGSLEKWLHCNEEEVEDEEIGGGMRKVSMMERLNIAIDIALAVEYLHWGTDSIVVHGDLKPGNILLDDDMNACVGDFGLAKIISNMVVSHESNASFGIRGTLGYVPPEYGTSDSISTQGDVYSYGILLLEIFTNKRPTDDLFRDHLNLHSFVAAALLPDQVLEILDPQFVEDFETRDSEIKDCVASILSIGVSCSKGMPKERMSITDVVNELRKIQKKLST